MAEHHVRGRTLRDLASKARLARVPGKGLGLIARRDLAPHTRVGVYGGKVYTAAQHRRMLADGVTTGKYAIDFYARGPRGGVRDGYIMDPGLGDGVHPSHRKLLAPFINEPGPDEEPNVVWVRNYSVPRGQMELRTTRHVRRGQELLACYGSSYPRTYRTSCVRRPGFLHYVSSEHRVPRLVGKSGR